jgi:hypothetical protein
MSNQVYANNMEVSCKAAAGKSICAFPDVCFTPPQTPATPPGVPIPYPNTGMASDTTSGSTSVKVSGKEVMLKNKSYFKKSMGDEAGCAPKKGVMTSVNRGKIYFIAWSMDVKAEGENVVRHLDMTTHNHNPPPGNSPPMAHVDAMATSVKGACGKEIGKGKTACSGQSSEDCSEDCKKAQKCLLVPKKNDKKVCCADSNGERTGHHMIEDHWVVGNSAFPNYRNGDAPCVCVNQHRSEGEHQEMHNVQGVIEESYLPGGARHDAAHPSHGFTYGEGKKATLHAHDATFSSENPGFECSHECLEAQLDAYYGASEETPLNKPGPGHTKTPIGDQPRAQTSANWAGVIRR